MEKINKNNKFIEKAKARHGDRYDYSKVDYKHNKTKATIICPNHGEFEQMPTNHLSGYGCPSCANNKPLTAESFLKKANTLHKNKYQYQPSSSYSHKTKINITCPEHGVFEQTINHHLSGQGCPSCATPALTTKLGRNGFNHTGIDEFINSANRIHNNKYDYSKVVYKNNSTKISIVCSEHGVFEQTPAHHLFGNGCPKCKIKSLTKDFNDFVTDANLVHSNQYTYKIENYKNCRGKVKIICSKHGEFEQNVSTHLAGYSCPSCGHCISKAENEIEDFLVQLGLQVVKNSRKIIPPKEIDLYLPELKIAIEYNGLKWHSNQYVENSYHYDKYLRCKAVGIRLIHIYEDEWAEHSDLIKIYLKQQLLKNNNSVYARLCTIKSIDSKIASDFLNKHHIQGFAANTHYLALFYQEELVSVAVFGNKSSSRNNNNIHELTRYASSIRVVGGLSKLVKRYIKEVNPPSIVTYSDNDKFTGMAYEKSGFKLVKESRQDYKVILKNQRFDKRVTCRKNLAKLLGDKFNPELSELQNCVNNKIYRIYDSGKKKWEYQIQRKTNV